MEKMDRERGQSSYRLLIEHIKHKAQEWEKARADLETQVEQSFLELVAVKNRVTKNNCQSCVK